jgi:endo-1,4-beta-xylanase
VALALAGCASPNSSDGTGGTGGSESTGGSPGTGGVHSTGGSPATGGNQGTGGAGTGGLIGTGGSTGGSPGTGGVAGGGGGAKGGAGGNGNRGGGAGGAKGGAPGTGGVTPGTGGSTGAGGAPTIDCNGSLPTSGGTMHTGSSQGTAAGMSWSLWQNGSGGSITTYSTPAFSSSWGPNSGDFLARIGLQWGNGKAYTSLGTVAADYAEKKTGDAGGYSYLGIYGWSTNPCVEWYIVDDSFKTMPVNPGNTTNKGTVTIDGGDYILYTRNTSGTGGSRCGSVSNWIQFYSVRKTARTCGRITISDHFAAWDKAGMTLGSVLEASILVEAGGGTGSIQFPTANVTATGM